MKRTEYFEVCSPKENMERDKNMLYMVERGEERFLFRIYKWKCFCKSFGYFQKNKEGIRRPTGGGYLYHGTDISFSIASLKEFFGENHRKIYKKYTKILQNLFKKFKIDAKVLQKKGKYGDSCYDYPSIGELSFGGKKLVCSAMRTLRKSFLIQSTVYITLPKDELKDKLACLLELNIKEEDFVKELYRTLSELQSRYSYDRKQY